MRKRLVVLQSSIALVLLLTGGIAALDVRYLLEVNHLTIDSWADLRRITGYAIFGKPADESMRFEFDPDTFGHASLRTNLTGHLPLPRDVDPNIEMLADFSTDSRYRKLAFGVGRLDLLVETDSGAAISPCTAFLISPTLLMTALHCLPAELIRGEIKVDASLRMGYFEDQPKPKQGIGVKFSLKLVEPTDISEFVLDYAVLELPGAAAQEIRSKGFVPVTLQDQGIRPDQDLFVIHHPLGDALHISRKQCRISSDANLSSAEPGGGSQYRFMHHCGTLPGTSGAPIFDDETHSVVAIHVSGDSSVVDMEKNDGWGLPISYIARQSEMVRTVLLTKTSVRGDSIADQGTVSLDSGSEQ